MADQGQHSNTHQQVSITPPPTSMRHPANRPSTRSTTRNQVPADHQSSLSLAAGKSLSQATSEDEHSLSSIQSDSLGGWNSSSTPTATAPRDAWDGSSCPLSSPPSSSPESCNNAPPCLIVRLRYSPTPSSGSAMAG